MSHHSSPCGINFDHLSCVTVSFNLKSLFLPDMVVHAFSTWKERHVDLLWIYGFTHFLSEMGEENRIMPYVLCGNFPTIPAGTHYQLASYK